MDDAVVSEENTLLSPRARRVGSYTLLGLLSLLVVLPIYLTIVRHEWVSRLDHAAYLGRQLTKAEYSIRHGIPFLQDGA